jgi:hypothetical protein
VDLAETEAEISDDFRQLPPNRQDCVLETARALSWAAKARTREAVKPVVLLEVASAGKSGKIASEGL